MNGLESPALDRYHVPQRPGRKARRAHVMAKAAGTACNFDHSNRFYASKEKLHGGPGPGHRARRAMVAGTPGEAMPGSDVERRYDQPVPRQPIVVRVKSGVLVEVTQLVNVHPSEGRRVLIEGSGEGARVVLRQ